MLRLSLTVLAAMCFSATAAAHPEPKTPKQTAATMKLPSQSEISKMRSQMPDFNAIFDDMGEVMQDGEAREGMTRSMDIMKNRMGDMKDMRRANGKPDFNKMMDKMLGLVGDEEFVGGLMDMAAPMQEVMERHAPAQTAPQQKRIEKQKMREFE